MMYRRAPASYAPHHLGRRKHLWLPVRLVLSPFLLRLIEHDFVLISAPRFNVFHDAEVGGMSAGDSALLSVPYRRPLLQSFGLTGPT